MSNASMNVKDREFGGKSVILKKYDVIVKT